MDINETAQRIHRTAAEHGFWDKDRNLGEMLMLATSELAESLEADRGGEPAVWFKHDDGCEHQPLNDLHDLLPERPGCTCAIGPKPEGAMTEIIDCIIRCFDTSQRMGEVETGGNWSVERVMAVKMDYNDRRQAMHGKAY